MILRKFARVAGPLLVVSAAFWIWYMIAADYDYGAVSGTYVYRGSGEESTLILRKDRTFSQQRTREGKVENAEGTWRRFGEGGVDFSKGFLTVGDVHPESDGSAYGEVQKSFLNLIPSVVLGQDRVNGPSFHRRYLGF